MINLLPKQYKKDIKAGRTNLLLVRYNLLMIGALIFTLASMAILYFYLGNSKAGAELTIADNKTKVGEYAVVETKAAEFRSHLTTAKQILNQEVTYTKTVLQIAHLIPAGVVIDTLALDQKTFGTATVISAHCKTPEAATALKSSFQGSPLLSNVHFESITVNENDSTGYPYTVGLNITINKVAIQ